MFYKKNSFT